MRSQYRSKTVLSKHTKEVKDISEGLLEDSSDDESSCPIIAVGNDDESSCPTIAVGNELLAFPSRSQINDKINNSSRPPKLRWLYQVDLADKISSAHFRNIYSFKCGELQMHEGLQFLRLTIHGESFMLHQVYTEAHFLHIIIFITFAFIFYVLCIMPPILLIFDEIDVSRIMHKMSMLYREFQYFFSVMTYILFNLVLIVIKRCVSQSWTHFQKFLVSDWFLVFQP